MALLKLKNIGKIYVSEGNVAVGIRGVNLSFDRGEFVAVTGKSGSGKSTLLNVLSGMDTYEEGEMYVEGNPTSHYLQSDWEEYRKKYISFIFQDYNIIESFTVRENVELALMNIENPRERKRCALELIKRVGLEAHLNHKGSKLSGGQKQRTVIARALAKDSPIILADEPTGNLDSQTSKEIIELLYEISKEKLVVVVTHNFDELEAYATRHIRVFDGAVESDHTISSENIIECDESLINNEELKYKRDAHMRPKSTNKHVLGNGIRLGRARFGARPKLSAFLCILMTVTALVITLMSSISEDALELFEKNYIFEYMPGRVIVAKRSGGTVSESDLESLRTATGAENAVRFDYMLDRTVYIELGELRSRFKFAYPANSVKPDCGRLPEKKNEVLLEVPISYKQHFGSEFREENICLFGSAIYKITGVKYYYDNTLTPRLLFTDDGYRTASAIAYISEFTGQFNCSVGFKYNGESSYMPLSGTPVAVDFSLPENSFCVNIEEYRTRKSAMAAKYGSNLEIVPRLSGTYGNYTYFYESGYYKSGAYVEVYDSVKPGVSYGDDVSVVMDADGASEAVSPSEEILANQKLFGGVVTRIFFSPDIIEKFIYEHFYAESYTQGSLFYKNDREAENALSELDSLGYIAVMSNSEKVEDIFEIIETVLALAVVGFSWLMAVSFAVLFLALCSGKAMGATKGDVAIMRSMGIPASVIKVSVYVGTLLSLVPAYLITAITCIIIYTVPKTNGMFPYIHTEGYLLIAISLLLVGIGLSRKHAKAMFKDSVKKTLRGGKRE